MKPDYEQTRWLDPEAAAQYICVRTDALRRLVKQGRIPAPSYALGPRSPRWDRLALDAAFEQHGAVNVRAAVQELAAKIIAEGNAKRARKRPTLAPAPR